MTTTAIMTEIQCKKLVSKVNEVMANESITLGYVLPQFGYYSTDAFFTELLQAGFEYSVGFNKITIRKVGV